MIVSSSRLGEQLPRDAAGTGAERVPGGQLLHAPAGAHQHEIGDVGGGNQQHEQHAAPQQMQRRAHVADDVRFERDERGVIAGVDEQRLERPGLLDVRRVRASICCCAWASVASARDARSVRGSGCSGHPRIAARR